MTRAQLEDIKKRLAPPKFGSRWPDQLNAYRAARDALWQRDVLVEVKAHIRRYLDAGRSSPAPLIEALEACDVVLRCSGG